MKYGKRLFTISFTLCCLLAAATTSADTLSGQGRNSAAFVSPNIVLSQVYGGGGAPGAQYTNDFVELFNRGDAPVSINGWSFQYASSSGTSWIVNALPNRVIQPGQYFLIQLASDGASGTALPSPDFIAPPVTSNGSTFILNLSRTSGKLALVNTTAEIPAQPSCPASGSVVDLIGYGASVSCSEGTRTADLSITTAALRTGGGCIDTDNNSTDFSIVAPFPRNSGTAAATCNLGSTLQAGISASPASVSPPGNTLLTVTVIPATTPASSGISVMGDLSELGGATSQPFLDNGANGDATAGDNVYSYLAAIPAGTAGGARTVTGSVTDAQGRTVSLRQTVTINAPQANEDPLLFGNPSGATGELTNENNYLMVKPQYTLSYNRSKATANWVAWRLDTSWIGSAPRQDDFRPDPDLPASWYHVQDTDYSGSGYDRGHMSPSGDRTNSVVNNSATFLMTNVVPQTSANNQGPWEDFESYCRTIASQGNELYIISGTVGSIGTIAGGKVTVPAATWKVVLILPSGTDDLRRVSRATRAFGIVVSNQGPVSINDLWRKYRVTVDAVEYLTGYDFFSAIPKNTQELIERKRDIQ